MQMVVIFVELSDLWSPEFGCGLPNSEKMDERVSKIGKFCEEKFPSPGPHHNL